MAMGLHLSWEKVLMRKALEKHVHRSDAREGMTRNIKAKYGVTIPADVDPGISRSIKGVIPRDDTEEESVVSTKVSFHHRGGVKSTGLGVSKGPLLKQNGQPKGANVGTLEVLTPRFNGGLLRCRISKCINVQNSKDTRELKDFLDMNCLWKPMPLQALGGNKAEMASMGRPPTPRRDIGSASGKRSPKSKHVSYTYSPKADELFKDGFEKGARIIFQGKKRHDAMPTSGEGEIDLAEQQHKEMVGDVSSWSFMRHLPVKIPRKQKKSTKTNKSMFADREVSLLEFEVLCSDAKALLEEFGEEYKADPKKNMLVPLGTPSAVELIEDLPKVTRIRWARIMEALPEERHNSEALARLLVMALQKEPSVFKLTAPTLLTSRDPTAALMLQLFRLRQSEDDANGQGSSVPVSFLTDCDSYGGRSAREERFSGVIRILKLIPNIGRMSEDEYGIKLNDFRLLRIAKAIDRGESAKLRGRLAAAGDRIHCSTIGSYAVNDPSLKARRGRQGITPDWLLAAIAEASDDEDLEEGDCLRLLVEVNTDTKQDADELPDDKMFSKESWVDICRGLGLLNRREIDVNDSDDDPEPSRDYETGLQRSLHDAISGAFHAKPVQESEAARSEALGDFVQVREAITNSVGFYNDAACGPFVLELLLQLAVRDWPGHEGDEMVPGGAAAIVCALLWSSCGWDSPIGRRLIRRLCVVFNQYADEGILSRSAFIQLARDAGWVTKRDMSTKNARLWKAFSEVVGEHSDLAEFGDFVMLIEVVANARCSTFDLQYGEGEGLAPIPGEGRQWPFIERAVLQATHADHDPIAPIWLRHEQLCKLPADDQRQSLNARCDSRGSLSSVGGDDKGSGGPRSRRASGGSSRGSSAPNSRKGSRRPSKGDSRGDMEAANSVGRDSPPPLPDASGDPYNGEEAPPPEQQLPINPSSTKETPLTYRPGSQNPSRNSSKSIPDQSCASSKSD